MKLFLLFTLISSISCSFKSSEESNTVKLKEKLQVEERNLIDSDGDLISDAMEVDLGTDPLIANYPKLNVNFLQNYSVEINFEDNSKFSMDTIIPRDSEGFKYKTGDLLLKDLVFDRAAKLGRFSETLSGEIRPQDYSWVKYPDIDKRYYFKKSWEFKKHQNKKITSISILLDNTLKVNDSALYNSIEDVELSFYYYSFSNEKYIQLHTEKLKRIFQAGVREEFSIKISNPPQELIEDTYFRHGKFIISEVKDFYIPKLKIKYSDLMKSIRAKTVPVFKTTPLGNELNYVAIDKRGEKFISILTKLYSDKFRVEENKLTQVEQFFNNLSDYEYLHELKNEEKSGKWFVMTNKIKDHYLKHNFTKSDSIVLSYLTGRELSSRVSEKIYSYNANLKSGSKGNVLPLGKVTSNSEIEFTLFPRELNGVKLNVKQGNFRYSPPQCRNCSGNNWSVSANFQVNSFSNFSEDWQFNDFSEALTSIDMLINNKVLNLEELVAKNFATIKFERDAFHIHIQNIYELDVLDSNKDNIAFVRLRPLNIDTTGEGLQVNSINGHKIDKVFHAGLVCFQEATKRKIPLAVSSWKFDEWEKNVPWGKTDPKTGFVPKKGQLKSYWTGTVVDLISTIALNYN